MPNTNTLIFIWFTLNAIKELEDNSLIEFSPRSIRYVELA